MWLAPAPVPLLLLCVPARPPDRRFLAFTAASSSSPRRVPEGVTAECIARSGDRRGDELAEAAILLRGERREAMGLGTATGFSRRPPKACSCSVTTTGKDGRVCVSGGLLVDSNVKDASPDTLPAIGFGASLTLLSAALSAENEALKTGSLAADRSKGGTRGSVADATFLSSSSGKSPASLRRGCTDDAFRKLGSLIERRLRRDDDGLLVAELVEPSMAVPRRSERWPSRDEGRARGEGDRGEWPKSAESA